MTTDRVDELVQDVRDDLDLSAVGLFQFIWALRGIDPAQSLDVMREQATTALKRLLADGDTYLVLLKWPSHDVLGTYDPADVGPDAWEDGGLEDPYVAIKLIDDPASRTAPGRPGRPL